MGTLVNVEAGKSMKIINFLLIFAFLLSIFLNYADLYITLLKGSPEKELNPFMKSLWINYGAIGLLIPKILLIILCVLGLYVAFSFKDIKQQNTVKLTFMATYLFGSVIGWLGYTSWL
jgi:hypothetical protein